MNFETFMRTAHDILMEMWEKAIQETPDIFDEFPTFNDFAQEVWVTID